MSRKLFLMLAVGLVVSACSVPLGRSVPECDDVQSSVVLEVQSVAGSAFVSCIKGLKTGWTYKHLEARSGRSVYSLDSDRLGDSFITVETVLSCDVGDARESDFYIPTIDLFKDIVAKTTVNVVVVPEGDDRTTLKYVADVRTQFQTSEVKDRTVAVSVLVSDGDVADRVRRAEASGAHVVIIGVRDSEEGTLTLKLSGDPLEYEGTFDQVLSKIEDVETESSYRGKWYHVFEGGCIVYTFDAEGPGVETLESAIEQALGFYDANELRQMARDAGYNLP
jgi:hypothetical protein